MDERPEALVGFIVIVAVLGLCLLTVSCVHDYAKSTPQVVEVLIVDKQHIPGHYVTRCSTDDKGYSSCHNDWIPPSWTVEYADEQRWTTSVSQGTWDAIRIGEKKVLQYDLGGGYWHARYNERFVFGPIVAEGGMPVR